MDFNHSGCNSRLTSWVSPQKKKKKVLELGKIICLSQSNIFDNALGVKKKTSISINSQQQFPSSGSFQAHWSFRSIDLFFTLLKGLKALYMDTILDGVIVRVDFFKIFFFFDNLQYINQKETDKARASSSQTEAKVAGRLLGLCELTWWQIKPNRIHWFGIVQVDLETNETIFIEGIMWVDLVTNEKARMLLILINIIIHFGVWTNGN